MPRPGPPVSSGREHVAVVLAGDRQLLEAQLARVEQGAVAVVRRDHDEFRAVEADVALEQRQQAAADRAEADHHDRTGEGRVQQVGVGHAGEGVHRVISNVQIRRQAARAFAAGEEVRQARSAAGDRSRGQAARAVERAGSQREASRRSGSYGPGRPAHAVCVGREAEAAVVRRIADQQDRAVAETCAASRQRLVHQRRADAAAARLRRRPRAGRAAVPDGRCRRSRARAATVPTRRPSSTGAKDRPSAASALRAGVRMSLRSARHRRRVEQALARRDVGRAFVADRDHDQLLVRCS